ncbi:hypothetical protein TBLA_0I02390 [Henningerozyma blattae CBS 6284]|uniref:PPIase cyclophilin-type domain-containing protein n=1 Tax=Henningerozyma blattae (strain ATCC 34711 / CBS 6284 / DSM 70876 / NBRC 10599 / NRRL Y-10934 / UCD 77-7) TaxID=1071380 RepID=I2H945_HENB6|nr:hypothetical protein TBLA_0I02390 [Tetrapisispora blattae CBS 6284]CCH62897.1 hypothetical protein TBLA_0I02390 [Tetrapisispora blattae CBS 6284]
MRISVSSLLALFALTSTAFAEGSPNRKFTTSSIDLKRKLEPSPPVTHNVYLTFKYYSPVLEREVEQDVTVNLYATVVPKTVENFIQLSRNVKAKIQGRGEEVFTIGYPNSDILNIALNNMILFGDVVPDVGPFSIHGPKWADENFFLNHDRPGRLSMYNTGPNTQNSKFMIDLGLEGNSERDNANVVFGQIVDGLEKIIDDMQYMEVDDKGKPSKKAIIEYATVEDQKHGNLENDHATYIKRLQDFRDGKVEVGTSMGDILKEKINAAKQGSTKTKKLSSKSNLTGDDKNNLFYLLGAIGIIYLAVAKVKKLPPFKNSKVVSMRRD